MGHLCEAVPNGSGPQRVPRRAPLGHLFLFRRGNGRK
jgi:hypothetical protein